MDQDQMESLLEVFDPVSKCHYRVVVPQAQEISKISDDNIIIEEQPAQNITTWSQTETLALINIFSLNKYKFKDFKKRKTQWNLISEELSKIGIHKVPEKCEIKWKNLMRVYRQHKNGHKGQSKFEFFNELDDVVSNDPQYKYIAEAANTNALSMGTDYSLREDSKNKIEQMQNNKRRKCSCAKSEKQKRHEDRMALMTKKMEIEERKVKAFEEYLQFLKRSNENRLL